MEQALFERIYASVVNREPTYDGIYYTAVRTTRIVCRPSCRARTPKAENVEFYTSLEKAVRAGFRPCKRCRPEEGGTLRPDAVLAARADAVMEARLAEKLTLAKLAEELAVSPFHLQRTYKRVAGCSPAARLDQLRSDKACGLLARTDMPVAEIGRAAGFKGASHFAAWFTRKNGLSPTEYRNQIKGGKAHEQNHE
ncbi:bifunctional transcriptional activator/DNA repair enzyme AdaA [Paenibacillus typhae]|uniref:AraC family transcriptional regulator, regulatory protein of adaptative response / methylphosphotriester-DNA alkyltransferase methyltransferase n=1 Tax=Paenibacillus typhae TaxID=1174501 RepID=A0A1G8K8D8_9BACL|nr:Ada metal-binding domain-containing protein [Paenibacillus typhae]SDI39681.1 AraC family transcriptional regulator, regulatory protein of adaptative response / methylphosphotriester-DNA alkyltransferase methyltransferase [Paenibacillus typhae]